MFLWACSGQTETGQAVGFVTHFTHGGVFWKSYDMELNKSQTGMTSTAMEVDLSIDNEHEDQNLVNELDSAQKYGWKVQIDYEQHFGTNCMNNRGQSSKFIKTVKILDKNPIGDAFNNSDSSGARTKSMKSIVASTFMVEPEEIIIPDFTAIDKRSTINRNNKSRVIVIRPKWIEWGAEFTLNVLEPTITDETVQKIIEFAGIYIGIGSYRPTLSGMFGKFELFTLKRIENGTK